MSITHCVFMRQQCNGRRGENREEGHGTHSTGSLLVGKEIAARAQQEEKTNNAVVYRDADTKKRKERETGVICM